MHLVNYIGTPSSRSLPALGKPELGKRVGRQDYERHRSVQHCRTCNAANCGDVDLDTLKVVVVTDGAKEQINYASRRVGVKGGDGL